MDCGSGAYHTCRQAFPNTQTKPPRLISRTTQAYMRFACRAFRVSRKFPAHGVSLCKAVCADSIALQACIILLSCPVRTARFTYCCNAGLCCDSACEICLGNLHSCMPATSSAPNEKKAGSKSSGQLCGLFRLQLEPTSVGRRNHGASQHAGHEALLQGSLALVVQRRELPRTLCEAIVA